jgi:putative aminopeptidase FrvX
MERAGFLRLLAALCRAHSPVGCEREIDAVLLQELAPLAGRLWQDAAGNIIALLPGRADDYPLQLAAHKDEVGLIVKRIEAEGRLRISPLGGAIPWKYGEGPVEVLGDHRVVPGVLCFGSAHVSDESPIYGVRHGDEPLTWSKAHVETKLSQAQLEQAGVHIGSKLALARHRKEPWLLRQFVCGYGLDDKAAVAVQLLLARRLREEPAPQDVYLIFSSTEENEGGGAIVATRSLPGETLLALEIAPAMPEYDLKNDGRPVIAYQDSFSVYDEGLAMRLAALAAALDMPIQRAVLSSFGSDASLARRAGAAPRIGMLCFPAENTHGYEMAHLDGIANTYRLAEAFVRAWEGV